MGLDAVLSVMVDQVTAAIAAAGITQSGAIFKGWPTATQIVEVLAQSDDEYQVSIWPLPGATDATSILADAGIYSAPVTGITATIDLDTVTFAGTALGPINIHGFVLGHDGDAYTGEAIGRTAAQCATDLAAAVNALAFPGVTATPSGNDCILTGADWEFVNIGGTGQIVAGESLRTARVVQVSVWTTGGTLTALNVDDTLRLAIYDAIIAGLGNTQNHFLPLPDGSFAYCMYKTDAFDDTSESSYSVYVAHIMFMVQYAIFSPVAATQVGDIVATTTVAGLPQSTQHIGG